MANVITKKQLRSTSLPSRSHPSTSAIEETLNRIKTVNTTTGSSESILMGLAGLEELYNCTEEFLKMGSTQRVMSSAGSEFMEEMLDGSLRLMDICNVSRELMAETHGHVRGVHSCVRRKKVVGGGDQLIVAVSGYVGLRKNMRKQAKKLLGSLKKIDGTSDSCDNDHADEHLVAVISAMRQVVSVSVVVLKSFLELLSGRQSNIKSKLASVLKKKKEHHEASKNELETLDSVICGDSCSHDDLQKKLEEVEMSVGGFERNLEGLFRRLIRTRASLLNIISH
ncbi:hypothetical protein CARUB_v10007523mg [Capsella rubella]|uniref:Uncharacterized protein n=1 Tax=Capsella rubella TaxID=81985 RepID=R0GPU8_9BRAS|nr:uncharacterized protein LOC17879917 [Capsella rubella]EOA18894.1 hypothetical protein CARUB_v10007523mg [Capsella rubella]